MQPPNELCAACRLRVLPAFNANTPEQIAFIQAQKAGEQVIPAGGTILAEGQSSDRLFTVLIGWAFRHKMLPDGRRQILNFVMPGDLIGLQSKLFDRTHHGIEALTDVTLCVFARNQLWDVFRQFPELAFDITWLAAHQERIIDEALLSVGRRSAAERIAWLVVHIWQRAEKLNFVQDGALILPITQTHIADALGLSLVHTNRTLQALRRRRLFELSGGLLRAVDLDGLRRLARYSDPPPATRPLF